MNISLSWDLFVIVFFVIILAYSFIIGRDGTLKVILGTYVSMIAADAAGNLFNLYFGGSVMFSKILKFAALGTEKEAVVLVKVVIFVMMVILFAIKGAFSVSTVDDRSAFIRMALSIFYAVMSAGLIISAVLVFISGVSFIGEGGAAGTAFTDLYNGSILIKSFVSHSYVWFSLPALSFLIHSFYSKK